MKLELKDIILKLTGNIMPVGCSSRDKVSKENLKTLLDLISELLQEVRYVGNFNRHSYEHSVKDMANVSDKYFKDLVTNFDLEGFATREQLEQAFMAGQSEEGIDPSYSNAQLYADKVLSNSSDMVE